MSDRGWLEWIPGSFLSIIIVGILIVFVLILVTLFIVVNQKTRKAMIGEDEMMNEEGIAKTRLDPEGYVFVKSELWRAKCDGGAIPEGELVVVKGIRGLTLIVEKKV